MGLEHLHPGRGAVRYAVLERQVRAVRGREI